MKDTRAESARGSIPALEALRAKMAAVKYMGDMRGRCSMMRLEQRAAAVAMLRRGEVGIAIHELLAKVCVILEWLCVFIFHVI